MKKKAYTYLNDREREARLVAPCSVFYASGDMNLPHELQHFQSGALLIASDSVKADFFLLGGDSIEPLDGVSLPKETGKDGEGSFEFFPDDASRLHAFAKQVAARIATLEREHKIPHIHLLMPAEVEHLVTHELPHDVSTKVGTKIHLDVMKEDPISMVKRLVGHLGIAS